MRKVILALTLCTLLTASCKKEEIKPEDVALQAAKAYYDQLLQGDYDAYLEGMLKGDSVAPDYRSQLKLNMQMYIERQKAEHKGISKVTALRATSDTVLHTVNAFLALAYADSTEEEIIVPMVEKNGVWYLK